MGLLHAKGASVDYTDPHVPQVHAREWAGGVDVQSIELTRSAIGQYDCVVIATEHQAFDYEALASEAELIVDTRNAIKGVHPHVFKLGAPRPESQGARVAVS